MSRTAQNRKRLRKHRRHQWLRVTKRDNRTKTGWITHVMNPNTGEWERDCVGTR